MQEHAPSRRKLLQMVGIGAAFLSVPQLHAETLDSETRAFMANRHAVRSDIAEALKTLKKYLAYTKKISHADIATRAYVLLAKINNAYAQALFELDWLEYVLKHNANRTTIAERAKVVQGTIQLGRLAQKEFNIDDTAQQFLTLVQSMESKSHARK